MNTHERLGDRDTRRAIGPLFLAAAFLFALTPGQSSACACGCGVFEVGTASLFPNGKGATVHVEYDFGDQKHNWSGGSKAPAADNSDKEIRTNFYTVGAQYMFDRNWGVMAELPVWDRRFRTDDGMGGVATFNKTAVGDVRLMGVYSGFSQDMSTGVIFGVKLPTGDDKAANFDRDTQIGTGSTDLLLGAYHMGTLCKNTNLAYFVQGLWDRPVAYKGDYKPGQEFDGAAGVYYNGATLGHTKIKVAPMLQLIVSTRARDAGSEANPGDSGYTRVLLAPGLELDSEDWKLYGDVEVPIYEHVNGNQLVAPALLKVVLSRSF
jgi:hypothetical protein